MEIMTNRIQSISFSFAVACLFVFSVPTVVDARMSHNNYGGATDSTDCYSAKSNNKGEYSNRNSKANRYRWRGHESESCQNTASCTTSDIDINTGIVVGNIYKDLNKNEARDINETGASGIAVLITDVNGNEFTAYTDDTGFYIQPGVAVGEAVVEIDETTLPAEMELSAGENPSIVNVVPYLQCDGIVGDQNASLCTGHRYGHRYGYGYGHMYGDANCTAIDPADRNCTAQYGYGYGYGYRGHDCGIANPADYNCTFVNPADCNHTAQYGYGYGHMHSDANCTAIDPADRNCTAQYGYGYGYRGHDCGIANPADHNCTFVNPADCNHTAQYGYGYGHMYGDANCTAIDPADRNYTAQYGYGYGYGYRGHDCDIANPADYNYSAQNRYRHRYGQNTVATCGVCSSCNCGSPACVIVYSYAGDDGYTTLSIQTQP